MGIGRRRQGQRGRDPAGEGRSGSIGYAELTYAVANRLPVALIRNRAGRFVEPTLESTTAAAAGALVTSPVISVRR